MTPEQKNHDESILALIFAEVKSITKHLKIDRRSKSNPDNPDGAETPDESEQLLRELLEKVGDLAGRKEFTVEQVDKLETMLNTVTNSIANKQSEYNEKIKTSLNRIGQALDTLKTAKQDREVHHRHTIDITSSKVFISMIAMGLLILGLSFVIGNQRRTLAQFRDNDLKYRYVKMHGEATPGDIEMLETIFTYDRNPDSIKIIHRQVVQYERLVKERAERIEQARFNASEAERLRNEVETVRERE